MKLNVRSTQLLAAQTCVPSKLNLTYNSAQIAEQFDQVFILSTPELNFVSIAGLPRVRFFLRN